MRDTFIKAVLSIGLIGVVGDAHAQGVRLTGDVTQSFQVDDNNNLSGGGLDFDSNTSLNATVSSQTDTSRISASSGLTLSFGSNQNVSITRPQLRLNFGTDTKDIRYSGSVSYSKAPAAVDVTQPDLSVLRFTGDRTAISGSLGATSQVSQSTSLRFGATINSIDFDPASAGLFPSVDYGLSAGVSYALNPNTSYSLNGGVSWFEAENASNTTSISVDLGGSIAHKLNSRTTFDGNLGWALTDTTDTISGVETSAFSVSLLFGAGLTQALPDGSISVALNQSVSPSSSGSLVLGTSLDGSYSKQVNQDVSYGIDASLSRQEALGGGTSTSFISVSPSYSRQLTRDVSATASYYLQRDNSGSTAQGVSISFSRPFDFPLR